MQDNKLSVGKKVLAAAFLMLGLVIMPKPASAAANQVDVSVSTNSVAEGNVVTFTFTTARAAVGNIDISYNLTGEANAASDYTFNNSASFSGVVRIDNGNSTAAVTLTTTQDVAVENDEGIAFTVAGVANLDDPEGANFNSAHATTNLIIVDDDSQYKLFFTASSSIMNESEGPMFFTVSLSNAAPTEVTFLWNTFLNSTVNSTTASGYAAMDGDFTGGSADYVLVTIPIGQTSAPITLNVTEDTLDEFNEVVLMTISSPTGATLGSVTQRTVTIEDNDTTLVSFSQATSSDNEGVTARKAQLSLSTLSDHDVTASIEAVAAQSTAELGTDWQVPVTAWVIPAGQLTKDAEVTVIDDSAEEADETAMIRIATVGDGGLGVSTTHAFIITANDTPTPASGGAYGTAIPQSTASVGGVPAGSVVVAPPDTVPPAIEIPTVPAPTTPSGEVLGVQVSLVDELIVKLNPGQVSDEVRILQTELQKLGFFRATFKPTRYYGPMTRAAVNGYLDGRADAMTLDELVAILKFGHRNNAVKKLQNQLKILFFFPATVRSTGYFGVITKASVAKYKNR
ncbi:MAG: peptidoglycan-binding protein [Candidatus Magasanikbacteria bacterium]|nr:peptidoglycan-binding protein [Candidatus Magasanikbacteria bacterium]